MNDMCTLFDEEFYVCSGVVYKWSQILPSSTSTQLNSTSTQPKTEVSLISTFSSHPPGHPATQKSRLGQTF